MCQGHLYSRDYGVSSSLNMCIINHLMSQTNCAFQARAFKIGTNVGLNVLFNTSSGFYQKQHFFAEFLMFFYAFPSIAT